MKELQSELAGIKEALEAYKKEVKSTVELTVKETVYRKNRDKDYVYDYPL